MTNGPRLTSESRGLGARWSGRTLSTCTCGHTKKPVRPRPIFGRSWQPQEAVRPDRLRLQNEYTGAAQPWGKPSFLVGRCAPEKTR